MTDTDREAGPSALPWLPLLPWQETTTPVQRTLRPEADVSNSTVISVHSGMAVEAWNSMPFLRI